MERIVSLACRFGVGACLVVAACSSSSPPEPPSIGRNVTYLPPVDPDPASIPLPKNADGQTRLTPGTPVEIGWAPPKPGPMTALAACTRWVSRCVSPPDRSVDDCARSVPVCKTAEPWNESACCPKACFDRYVTARKAGAKPVDAFDTAYFDRDDNCIPGVSAIAKVKP